MFTTLATSTACMPSAPHAAAGYCWLVAAGCVHHLACDQVAEQAEWAHHEAQQHRVGSGHQLAQAIHQHSPAHSATTAEAAHDKFRASMGHAMLHGTDWSLPAPLLLNCSLYKAKLQMAL